jgi:integrase
MVLVLDQKGGGGKSEVYVPDKFWDYCEEYLELRKQRDIKSDILFPTLNGNKLSGNSIYNIFKNFNPVLEQFGVEGANLGPHFGRRSRASQLYDRTGNVKKVMSVTRHRTLNAVQQYVNLSSDSKDKKKMLEDGELEL